MSKLLVLQENRNCMGLSFLEIACLPRSWQWKTEDVFCESFPLLVEE